MNKLILAAPLSLLLGCATVPPADAVARAVDRAVAAEGVVAARCALGPMSVNEKLAQTSARLLFASSYGPLMSDSQRDRYERAMDRTDEVCGVS